MNQKTRRRGPAARRAVLTLLVAALCVAALVSGTFAWTSLGQSAVNAVRGAATASVPVRLEKYERQADGTATVTPVPGAEFALYNADNGQRIGGLFHTDAHPVQKR